MLSEERVLFLTFLLVSDATTGATAAPPVLVVQGTSRSLAVQDKWETIRQREGEGEGERKATRIPVVRHASSDHLSSLLEGEGDRASHSRTHLRLHSYTRLSHERQIERESHVMQRL